MQLIFAIVQEEDADGLCQQLNDDGHRLTRIRSSGGFLSRGNITVMCGLADVDLPRALAIIRETCRMRRSFVNSLPYGPELGNPALGVPAPVEVEVGGATVFTVPVRRFLRLRGVPAPPAVDERYYPDNDPADAVTNDLIIAIVRAEDADPISQALERTGFRLTRVPTLGGFLRRGNMTLLAAVSRPNVAEAIEVIQDSCHYRVEAKGARGEMPMFSATVFVVELTQFVLVA